MVSKTQYHAVRAHIGVPERSQLPEYNGDDEDHPGHCGWGATVDTIGCSQVRTAEKDGIAPPNRRSSLGRTGGHEKKAVTKGQYSSPNVKWRCSVAKPIAIPLISLIVSPSVNQTFHPFSSLAPIPIPTGRWTICPSTHFPPLIWTSFNPYGNKSSKMWRTVPGLIPAPGRMTGPPFFCDRWSNSRRTFKPAGADTLCPLWVDAKVRDCFKIGR